MGNGCEPTGTSDILEEPEVRGEPIEMVVRRGRLEWFGHVKRSDWTETNQVETFFGAQQIKQCKLWDNGKYDKITMDKKSAWPTRIHHSDSERF